MYFKIGVLKSFVLFTGKHACWSLLLTTFHAFFDRTPLVAALACDTLQVHFVQSTVNYLIQLWRCIFGAPHGSGGCL